MPKSWTLTIPNSPLCTLTLTPSNQRGICWTCHLEKQIWVVSDRIFDIRKFCYDCALNNLDELAEYEFANKSLIIKELRHYLNETKSPDHWY